MTKIGLVDYCYNNMKLNQVDYRIDLYKRLQDKVYAGEYLSEILELEEQGSFLVALENVLTAQKSSFSKLAIKIRASRQGLYKSLSEKGNPRLATIKKIMLALGFRIVIEPVLLNNKLNRLL